MPRYALYNWERAAYINARSDKRAIEQARLIVSQWAAQDSAWASAHLVRLNKYGERHVDTIVVRAARRSQ